MFPTVEALSADDLIKLREREDVVVIDVRHPDERAVSHIPGSITIDDLKKDETRNVVCYCTVGRRSGHVATQLSEKMPGKVFNSEGILAYSHHPMAKACDENDGDQKRRRHGLVKPDGSPASNVHAFAGPWTKFLNNRFEPVTYGPLGIVRAIYSFKTKF